MSLITLYRRVIDTFIPKESGPLILLTEWSSYHFPMTLIIRYRLTPNSILKDLYSSDSCNPP